MIPFSDMHIYLLRNSSQKQKIETKLQYLFVNDSKECI